MTRMLILTEAELRRIVPLDLDAVACVEKAFRALATAKRRHAADHAPRHSRARAEVDVKTAYVPGMDGFAIKISPGFFDNPKLGLPSVNGMMVLLSARTGLVEALLLDNGYLTDVRTAAAGAVAAKLLARPDASVAAVLGRRRAGRPAARGACFGAADPRGAALGARPAEGGRGGAPADRAAAAFPSPPKPTRRPPCAAPTSSSPRPPRPRRCSTADCSGPAST